MWLSLDLSSTNTGFTLWKENVRQCWGNFKCTDKDYKSRVRVIVTKIKDIIDEKNIEFIVIEELPHHCPSQKAVEVLAYLYGYLRSCIDLSLHRYLHIWVINSRKWRQIFSDYGVKLPKGRIALKKAEIELYSNLNNGMKEDDNCVESYFIGKYWIKLNDIK
jgi:hypothetical protein